LIAALLPAAAAVEWARGDLDTAELYPEEAAVVARAVEKRRREFATGRTLARNALERLGVAARAISPGERGEPLWPDGVVGSITHCAGYRACAVARASELVAIGIDAEPDEPLPPGVLEAIARPEELRALAARRAREPGVHWDRLLFSAKEAVFKTWFPLTGQRLGFEDATLEFESGAFAANLPAQSVTLPGRWGRSDGLVLTAIALSQDWRVGA
jgi:4'-phosphopantetheinyl transferase EntD